MYYIQKHYKALSNLAILLKTAGYKVAIAEVFKEADLCKVEDVLHLSFDVKCPKEFKNLHTYVPKESALKIL